MVAVSGLSLLFFGNATRGFVDGANAYVVDRRKVAIIDFMIRMYFRCDIGSAVFCVLCTACGWVVERAMNINRQ